MGGRRRGEPGTGRMTYDCCLVGQALVVGNGFLVASVG